MRNLQLLKLPVFLLGLAAVCFAQHVPSGPISLTNASNQTFENLRITSTVGPCVKLVNSTNIVFHNSEIGPCDTTDTNCNNAAGGQAFNISGGSGIQILDSYVHTECPGIVNKTHNQTIYDNGDNILILNSPNALIQGNIIAWGESNVQATTGDTNIRVIGNFLLNPIQSTNLFNKGQQIVVNDGSNNALMDRNYAICSSNTALYKYVSGCADQLSAAAFSVGAQQGVDITNNYVTGGGLLFQCAINMDGGANGNPGGATSHITGNNLFNIYDCGLSIESGYNYVVSNNKNLSTNAGSTSRNGIQAFQCYAGTGSACPTGQIIPCGNIAYTNNLSYSILPNNSITGAFINTNPPNSFDGCTNVTGGTSGTNGNIYDSGTGPCPGSGSCGAFNSMQPGGSNPFPAPPAIPPVPFSCVTASPYTNNVAVAACGATPPPPTPTSLGRLNTKIWTFVNPVGDGSYKMPGKQLNLIVPGGVNHDPIDPSGDNSVRVKQTITNSDFDVTMKFDTIPVSAFQLMGLMVHQDSANYLRFGFASTGVGSPIFISAYKILANTATETVSQQIANPTGASLWLRVQRATDTYTMLYSFDNITYTTAGSFTQAITVADFGPFAGNSNATPVNSPAFSCFVDSFTVN